MRTFGTHWIALLVIAIAAPAWADGEEPEAVAKRNVAGETIEAPGGVIVEILGRQNVTLEVATEEPARSYEVCFASANGNWGRPGMTCPLKSGPRAWKNARSRPDWGMP